MTETNDKRSVLVVDDTPANIDVLAGILKGTYKVKVAKDGERALKIAGSPKPPEAILLDVMMPGMDGYEVCERLKDDPNTRDIPVVFVTGASDAADREMGLSLGAVGYLTKPIDQQAVMSQLEDIFG